MVRSRQLLEDQFTDSQKKEIIDCYNNGMTQVQIGNKFGLPRRSIMKLLDRLGVKKRSHKEVQKSGYDDKFVEKVKDLRTSGHTMQQIADLIGRSTSAVNRICKKYNIQETSQTNVDISSVCDDYKTMSLHEIATKYNISSYAAKNILIDNGVKIRDPIMSGARKIKISDIILPNFEDSREWWCNAYEAYGMSSIAKFLNRSVGYVAHKLKSYDMKVKRISDRQIEFDKDELVRAYKYHGSMSKVAKRFNCTITTVSNVLEAKGIIPVTTSEMFSGEGNPFYGKEHPQDIKDYCKEIGAKSGKQFWIDNPEYVKVVKEKQKEYWSDVTKRYEVSKRTAALRKEGKCNSRRGNVDTKWGRIQFDSSYEMNFIEWCESNENIVLLERDFDLLEYEYNGRRHFVPDFRLWLSNGDFLVVEIKSDWLRMRQGEQQKILTGLGKFQDKFVVAANNFDKVDEHIGMSLNPEDFEFDDLELKEVNSFAYLPFYQAFHYMGISGRRGWTLGAYLNDKLIAAATIGSITRQEIAYKQNLEPSEMRELVRFCIHPQFHKKNMASWFLSRVVKTYRSANCDIKMLVSFADTTQGHVGTIYKAAGWDLNGETRPNYHYEDNKQNWIHKKTVYNQAKKIGMTETEFAQQNILRRIPEAAKMRFVLKL